jgi:CCR4-NOT transcription complex subunit 2
MSSQTSSLWATGGGPSARVIGGQPPRQQSTPLPAAAQPENMYPSSSSRVPTGQNAFQFGGRSAMAGIGGGQASQIQSSSVDEFPPLSRTATGEPSQDRGASLMSTLGFGGQSASSPIPNPRGENGLLNAISASSRATEPRTPSGASLTAASLGLEASVGSDGRQKTSSFRDESQASGDSHSEGRNPLGAIGNGPPASKAKEPKEPSPESRDLLATFSTADKWGIAGLRHLMETYSDYTAMAVGLDPTHAGIDINVNEWVVSPVVGHGNGDADTLRVGKSPHSSIRCLTTRHQNQRYHHFACRTATMSPT